MMITRKIIILFPALLLSVILRAQTMTWEAVPMDGSRTGTFMPDAYNVEKALGTMKRGVYTAPNGRVYSGGVTPKVASLMLDAQDSMADMKEVIAYCPREMRKYRPESELSNMLVDCLMRATEEKVGKHVDVGLLNMGGIRESIPEGNVLLADIYAMLPFQNYLCYVELKGSDLKAMLMGIAANVEALGGVRMEIKGRKLQKLLVGGEPVDDDRIYGLATIDFLLAGGDGISSAKNAKSLTVTDMLVRDAVIPYIRSFKEEGRPVEYSRDGRVVFLK